MFSGSRRSHNHQLTAEAETYKPATSTSRLHNQEMLLRQRDQKLKSEEKELEQKEGAYSVRLNRVAYLIRTKGA